MKSNFKLGKRDFLQILTVCTITLIPYAVGYNRGSEEGKLKVWADVDSIVQQVKSEAAAKSVESFINHSEIKK